MSTDTATAPQIKFLASLIRKVDGTIRSLPAEQADAVNTALANLHTALAMCEAGTMDKGECSKVIEQAKGLVEAIATVVPDNDLKWRKIPGTDEWGISGPSDVVVAGATLTVTNSKGEESEVYIASIWGEDKGRTLGRKGRAPATVIPAGVHIVPGVGLYRSEGRHYCDRFVPCHWVYAGVPKGVTLDQSTLVDARGARAVSWLLGNCCFCGLDLSNPASLVAGYGPTCAKKRDLPHGSVEVPDRAVVLAELLWLASLEVGVSEDYARQRAEQYSDRLDRDA